MRKIRSLQRTGGETFIVSLPKTWVKNLGLKQKDKVVLLEQENSSLVIYPLKFLDKKPKENISIIYSSLGDENTVIRECISNYLAGYDSFKIIFDKENIGEKSSIKNILRDKLIGIEVIEEDINSITIQVFAENKNTQLDRTLNRLYGIVYLMLESLLKAIRSERELLKEIIKLDDEVDRFYHFIARQINLAIEDPYLMLDLGVAKKSLLIEYRLFSKTLERIADHIESISRQLLETEEEIPHPLLEKILKLGEEIKKLFSKSVKTFINLDVKLAYSTAREIEVFLDKMYSSSDDLSESNLSIKLSTRMIKESLKRILEYSLDICELAINLDKLRK